MHNFLDLPPEQSDPKMAGVVILPVPYEATSTYGKGSHLGPQAIIEASPELELFDAVLGFDPVEACRGIATLDSLDVVACSGSELAERLHSVVSEWIARGKFVVVLGGEHTSTVGAIRASCTHFSDTTVLDLDAHSDLRASYAGSPWNHACAMARVLDFTQSVVQAGIRSQAREERLLADRLGLPVFYAHRIHDEDSQGRDWIGPIIQQTKARVHVSLDCDVMDPALLPATGTPEPGGLTWRQLDQLFARLSKERQVVGLDISELAPIPGFNSPQFTVAKLLYRFIGRRFQPG